jgi:hypothetical protein
LLYSRVGAAGAGAASKFLPGAGAAYEWCGSATLVSTLVSGVIDTAQAMNDTGLNPAPGFKLKTLIFNIFSIYL